METEARKPTKNMEITEYFAVADCYLVDTFYKRGDLVKLPKYLGEEYVKNGVLNYRNRGEKKVFDPVRSFMDKQELVSFASGIIPTNK